MPAGAAGSMPPLPPAVSPAFSWLVVPPPVVRPPPVRPPILDALSPPSAATPPGAAARLSDTVSDSPNSSDSFGTESQASDESMSLIVVTRRPSPMVLVVLLAFLLPIALAAAALLIHWIWQAGS